MGGTKLWKPENTPSLHTNDDEDTKLWLPVDACCWLKTNCKLNFD